MADLPKKMIAGVNFSLLDDDSEVVAAPCREGSEQVPLPSQQHIALMMLRFALVRV